MLSLVSGALTALALLQQVDTTVPAQQGQRLVVDGYAGEIDVKTWGRNAVRVEADPTSRTSVQVVSGGSSRRSRSPAIKIATPHFPHLVYPRGVMCSATATPTKSNRLL